MNDLLKINNVSKEQEELRATKNLWDRQEGCVNKGSEKEPSTKVRAETWAPCTVAL